MELIKNINDIIENVKRADGFLYEGNAEEREFMLEKISRGRCFIIVREGKEYKFYPSKYVGYKDNNPSSYTKALDNVAALEDPNSRYGDAAMYDFDGRMSNKAINAVLKCKCEKDYKMSERFIEYCRNLGLKGSDKKKFWLEVIEKNEVTQIN